MLFDITGSEKSKMAASKTGETSACRQDRNEIPTAIGLTMFSRSSNPVGLSVLGLTDRAFDFCLEYREILMKARSVSVRPYRNYEIQYGVIQTGITYISACRQQERNVNGFTHVFGVGQHGETSGHTDRCLGMSKIKDGGH